MFCLYASPLVLIRITFNQLRIYLCKSFNILKDNLYFCLSKEMNYGKKSY